MIDLTIHRQALDYNIQKARESGVVIPVLGNMRHPETVLEPIRTRLRGVGLWDADPLNLFRIAWKNESMESGGPYRVIPNYIELPPALADVPARIIAPAGKRFPTGCYKVGALFGCLAPRLIIGQFDARYYRAVWLSTGNYYRGGAFSSKLLRVRPVAILPTGMSWERFGRLSQIAGEVIVILGYESSVKEIFDETHELRQESDCMIFSQFEEMDSHLWYCQVTGFVTAEVFEVIKRPSDRLFGACFTLGSAGTIGCGDYSKEVYPDLKLAVGRASQCSAILENGFGDHRIEGIGDKHTLWIHNVKNTDMVIDIDDEDFQRLLQLLNDPAGHDYLWEAGVPEKTLSWLSLLGISGTANVLCYVKLSKYYELTEYDVVATVLTDSAGMHRSCIQELADQYGPYDGWAAAVDHALHLLDLRTDIMVELNYYGRKRVYNLKYYTWVEQQGRDVHELSNLWYGNTWDDVHRQATTLDELVIAFNEETGVLKRL